MSRLLSSRRVAVVSAPSVFDSLPRIINPFVRRIRQGSALLGALLFAGAADAAQLTLSWTDNADNETGFYIERSTDGSSYTQIATVGANVESYTDTGLPDSTTYWYRVCAYNAGGSSAYSNIASATTPAPSNQAPTISNITNRTINEDSSTGAIAFTIGDAETSAGSLIVSGSSSNLSLVPNNNIAFGGSGATRSVTVTPDPDQSGSASITVTVSDGALSATTVFSVAVSTQSTDEATALADGIFNDRALDSAQIGAFTATFEAIPSSGDLDSVIGLSHGPAAAYTDLAAIVRFNMEGRIDARDGDSYVASTMVPYAAGQTYAFRLEIDLPAQTYSAFVTPPGGSELTIGVGLAFRSEQSGVAVLDFWSVQVNAFSTDTTMSVRDFAVTIPMTNVEAPEFSIASGTFNTSQSVTLRTATAGASIRYTIDGTTPTLVSGIVYNGPVTIASTTTLRAVAHLDGAIESPISSATYTIIPPAPAYVGPRYFFGNFGSDQTGTFGLLARENDTGLFVASVASHPAPIESVSFPISESGAFTFSVAGLGTVTGQIVGDTVSGSISGTALSFSGTMETVDGSTESLAGLYDGMAVNSSDGRVLLLVGPAGQTFVLNVFAGGHAATFAPIASDGTLSASLSNGTAVAVTVNPVNGTLTGTIASNSQPYVLSGTREDITTSERLINTSVRAHVEQGAGIMIAGFVVKGTGTKQILVRGVGPAMARLGVSGTLVDPMLKVYRQRSTGSAPIAENDDWEIGNDAVSLADISRQVYAFSLPAGGKDAALLLDLPAGAYTAHVSGVNDTTGAALVEVYDTGSDADTAQLANISLRGEVGTGEDSVIAGFVVNGTAPKRLLIRAVGPELTKFGVPETLEDPKLTIFRRAGGTETMIATNDDWGSDSAVIATTGAHVGAFSLTPGSKTAAMTIWLEPGIYTAQATSSDTSKGIALVEVYEIP